MKTPIPKIIHLTCKEKPILIKYQPFYERLKGMHQDWEIRIYNDAEARQLVVDNFPQLIKMYDSYRYPIQRTDIFRVLAVYVYGGFYFDMDMYCLKKLDELCSFSLILGEEKTLSIRECENLKLEYQLRIGNYAFGSVSKHPFWIEFLNAAIDRKDTPITTENDILETTGPGLLNNVYHQANQKFEDIILLRNDKLICVKNCRRTPSCHFGDYAAHYHLGSWRWKKEKHHYQNV